MKDYPRIIAVHGFVFAASLIVLTLGYIAAGKSQIPTEVFWSVIGVGLFITICSTAFDLLREYNREGQ